MESSKTREVKAFYVMDVLERANAMERAGQSVIHLEVGEPDFDTPEPIREAAIKALKDGDTHYTHSLGLPELREAICHDFLERYGVTVHPDQVAVTNGTSPAMFLVFAALLEQSDEVIISDPHYACYPSFIRYACGKPVTVPVHEDDGFQLRAQAIREKMTDRTRAVFINSPSNPTGNLLSAECMEEIAKLGPAVVSDEIYHGLVYEGKERSILEFTDQAFVLNGFSKLYAMTGLRLGYVIAPKAIMRGVQKLTQNFYISANTVSQRAGIAALTQCAVQVETMRQTYDERRRFMLARLREMGLGVSVEPTGAFYSLANVKRLCEPFEGDSYKLAFDILEKAGVGVTPGTDFGQGGQGYIRLSYANSLDNIKEGMDRLEKYVRQAMDG